MGLKSQIIMFFSIFLTILCALITIMGVMESSKVASIIFSQEGITLTKKTAALIDGDTFERLARSLDDKDPAYEEIRLKMIDIKEDSSARYLYTMAPVQGNIYKYVIDGSSAPGTKNFSPIGTEDDVSSFNKAFFQAWKTQKSTYSTIDKQEGWGYVVSIYTPIFNSRNQMVGIVGCDFDAESLYEMIMSQTVRQSIAALILAVVGIVAMVFFMRLIFVRLKNITNILQEIAEGEGDLTTRIKIKKMDEIGTLVNYFNQTLDKIRNMVVSIKGQTVKLSDIGSELAGNMMETATAINQITTNIQSIKSQAINQSASVTETSSTMEQVTLNINKLNSLVENQTESVTQSSSAIEEMLANIQSVTQTLVRNEENVEELTAASDMGRTGLQGVSADIQEISRESEGLLEINSVMQNIASQTNLLSMNAAIEAAHAGEAGRGFAVVADEIRKLAENSGKQSKIISDTLKKIKDAIDKITKSTNTVLSRFEAIGLGVKIVADQESEIRNAMEEQAEGSKQILGAIAKLNEITQQVKQGSVEMLEGSKEVINESRNLEKVTQEITNGVNEMASGADQINSAVNRVNNISGDNKEGIGTLVTEVSRFKVDMPEGGVVLYQWDRSLETGNEMIDEQHKQLFAAINALLRVCDEGKSANELKKSLNFLNDYTIKHFFEEEQLQKKYAYPDYENHHKMHEAFKKTVRDLMTRMIMNGSSKTLIEEVQQKIGGWLVTHIKGQDVKIGAHIRSKETGK
jgi:methyl-accepting chemotaxis protein